MCSSNPAKHLVPILLFVYNRPHHTKITVDALKRNKLAGQSELIIYSDAPNNSRDELGVAKTRELVDTISGFKKISVVKRENNVGLARNIVAGITEVLEKYDACIVLEDDIVTSPAFLQFMNNCLEKYRANKKVWHVNGWAHPIKYNEHNQYFFWRVMNCWGWATWSDRWKYFEKDPNKLALCWDEEKKCNFDINWSGVYWSQVVANLSGKLNTWAVFWYATIYQHGGLCLQPTGSYVVNIGLDGSGQNSGSSGKKDVQCLDLNLNESPKWPEEISEATVEINSLEDHFKAQRSWYKRHLSRVMDFIWERVYRK